MLSYQELPTSIQVWRGHGQEAKIGSAGGPRITRNVKRLGRRSSRVRPPGCPCSRCGAWAVPLLGVSRGRPPWHSRRGATGCARGGWRCCGYAARPFWVATCAVNYCATHCSVVSLDSVDEYEQARSEDARYTLLMHDTRSASGGSYGVHHLLLSAPTMHTLRPTRLWHASGPLWSRSRHSSTAVQASIIVLATWP